MAKTKNLLFVMLAALMMTGSVIITGCTSSDFWNTTSQIKIEKSFKVNVPKLDYSVTIKVKIENNAMYLTVAGFECEPIYLKEIFTEADSDRIEFTMDGEKVKEVAVGDEKYEAKY
jgi:hypothetical protein